APSGAPSGAPIIVICDDLATTAPATFQFMLHSGKAFVVDEARAQLVIEQPKAGAVISYLSPAPLKFRQWDGYDPKPEKDFPNQWHVEAGTQEKKTEMQMLTVITPYRAGQRRDLKIERLDSPTAVGARISEGSKGFFSFHDL
ncbi:MAG: hypothetical protein NTX50_23495, partial [Candidatus Sumerlaeota bacterium]|nr:hypothetical protein [Candidatus Sumerlaeota bacterium]